MEPSLWELFKHYVAEVFRIGGWVLGSVYHQISNWKFGSCLWWARPVTVMVVAVMVVVDMKVDMKATKLIQGRKARVDIK